MSDFDEDWDTRPKEEEEYFNAGEAVKHLLIVKVHDVAKYYRSENHPDGMVRPTSRSRRQFEPFPNQVVRASIADLSAYDEDGERGKVYPLALLFPSSLTKIAKEWVGASKKLVMWNKGPKQTDEYEIRNMATNERAMEIARDFMRRHPEFDQIPAPEPYDGHPPRDERDDRRDDRDRDRDRDDRPRRRQVEDWDVVDRHEETPRSRAYERDPWDEGSTRTRSDRGARDHGQHDDFGRRPNAQDSQGGSFMERTRNHRGEPQREEDIPF